MFWSHVTLGLGLALVAVQLCSTTVRSATEVKAEGYDFFERKIRPVLVEHCYQCHSASAEKVKGGLLLDSREGVLKGGESGKPLILPGDAEGSRLIEAIRYADEGLQMPPKKAGGKLSDAQIADFVAWVDMGAPDPRTGETAVRNQKSELKSFWAFRRPAEPPVPRVKNRSWPRTAMDRFILAKLEEKGIQSSPPADKRTLIRRACYDLTGLPPRPDEVDAFLEDASPEAFARVVDRLLSSPRYGERWGRYWLDVARYSDTKGYVYSDREEGRFVHSYAYRDWVIRAFNEDMPYDRFLRLQIAADQLVSASDRGDLAAMGFLTLGRRFLGVVHDIIDDRIDVVMRGAQGLTVGCARCHDHKYDPIPTKDYYALYGVFNGSTERELPLVADLEHNERYAEFVKGLREREQKLQQTFRRKCDELSERLRAQSAQYLKAVLDVNKLPSEEFYAIRGPDDLNPTIVRQWDAYLRRTAGRFDPVFALWHEFEKLPAKDFARRAAEVIHSISGRTHSTADPAIQGHACSAGFPACGSTGLSSPVDHERATGKSPEPAGSKACATTPPRFMGLMRARIGVGVFDEPERRNPVGDGVLRPASRQGAEREVGAPFATLPGAAQGQETVDRKFNPLVLQAFASAPPASMSEVAACYGEMLVKTHAAWRDLLKKAETDQARAPEGLPDENQEELRRVLYAADSPVLVPPGAIVDLEWYFDEGGRVELAKLQAEIDRWIIKSASPPYAVILEDRPTQHNPRVFIRGNPVNKGEEVPRRFLEILAGEKRRPFSQGSGRLELANAIASKDNPLTARVMVNRIWLHHFGAGLVRTPSDFGTRCEPPSHPELLDWLACRFMAEGWSIKKLHRLIMLSAVYQQSSEVGAVAAEVDPENRFLWHFNRQRLDFESARDSLIAVSGELDVNAGGKPIELFRKPFALRRTVYGFIDRQFLPGVFRVFDFANPDMHSPQRLDTTVPQQALFFMNSPFVVERARALAEQPEVVALKNPERRIQELYRLVFQRPATARQMKLGKRFLAGAELLPAPEPPKPVVSPWQYGFGEYDEQAQRLKGFEALPHFAGEAWQGGANWPDAKLGWVQLTAQGGHAGNDLQHAAVRRWIAPRDAVVSISGTLQHERQEGDGIRGRIVSSRTGQLGNWTLHKDKAETKVESVEVRAGDTIDFVVDFNADLNSDDFTWSPILKAKDRPAGGSSGEYPAEWNAKKDFSGPPEAPPRPLSIWGKYAQVLLLSNEFMFVD